MGRDDLSFVLALLFVGVVSAAAAIVAVVEWWAKRDRK